MQIEEILLSKTKVKFFDDYIKKEEIEYILKDLNLVLINLIEEIEEN